VSSEDPERFVGAVVGGRFLVDRLIGRGGFAWVFHAVDEIGRDVAVKVLRTTERVAALRFARETRVLAALPPSAYVAGYVAHGSTADGWPFLAIEHVDGVTLHEGLARCVHLPEDKAVAWRTATSSRRTSSSPAEGGSS
jgi:serine/threonine protein kinase